MRSDILASAILANVDSAVNEAKPKFRAWMEKNARVPPNLREVVYAAGILIIFSAPDLLRKAMDLFKSLQWLFHYFFLS